MRERHEERAVEAPRPEPEPAPLSPSGLVALQRSAGNAATSRVVSAFGEDFSSVRLHPGSPRAGGSTLALAEGSDIHFAPGAYRPGSAGGDHLLAHELAHIAQQRRGPSGADRAALEADAERAAADAVAGRPADVLLGAPAGAPQHYEANEHEGLGNTAGGDAITVVTKEGVRLTYGQIVALSGDFYRSPEAIMNAPADELRGILDVMRHEKELVAQTGGRMTGPDAATLNAEYEAATSGSARATHHDHSSFSDHDHEGHEDHDADHEADEEEAVHGGHAPRRMTKYGPVVGDESIEDAGEPEFHDGEPIKAGQLLSATGSFLELADENSSHFSPENIRLNFKPKHLLALDLAREAWEARNPGMTAPPVDMERVAQSSALDPRDAAPTHVTETSSAPGDQQEARALMTSGFAAHFLTDAFAGGHVVSGVFGRKHAPTWYAANRDRIEAALVAHYEAAGSWGFTARAKAAGMLKALDAAGGVPGIMLKLVHDRFNEQGIQVKNPKGTVWATKGDGHLAGAPETKAQAEAAAKTARDAVQDTVATGEAKEPYAALDYVPDVAMTPGSPAWRPIETAATDPSVFEAVWEETMVAPGDTFFNLVGGYVDKMPGLLGSKAKLWGLKKLESVKRGARDVVAKTKEVGAGIGDWFSDRWDDARALGTSIADEVVDTYRGARRGAAGWLGDTAQDLLGDGGKQGEAPTSTGDVSEVNNQTYAHGGFMGAAGAFMHDPHWNAIFAALMPEAHARATKIAEPEQLQLELENNPVLAAYGSVRHRKEVAPTGPPLPLEWDVWLPPDPKQITDLSSVKIAHGNLGTTVAQGVGGADPVGYARDDVKNSPHAGRWMELFGEAVAMHRGPESQTCEDTVQTAKEYLGPAGGLILDVKSTYSTPAAIATFVKFLREQGINVFGVGTFKPEQLAELGEDTRKVTFFHGINDLESKRDELAPGADVMFNGGSLLDEGREYVIAGDTTYEIDQDAYQRLVALQRELALNVGIYVQESAVSPDAVQRLTELVNRNPSVFTRGFAYGNVSGSAEEKTEGTGIGAQKWMDW